MTEDAVLEARNLTKRYRGVAAFDQVNLRLECGEIYGFMGENGAGKTTLMHLIADCRILMKATCFFLDRGASSTCVSNVSGPGACLP